mmetsp:Transcript_82329/g.181084  ORF Transcript_82329/g.181084 Transcript_82329/m.181084 type:complete len:384 (+) Transcript_82329:75-1226(+)
MGGVCSDSCGYTHHSQSDSCSDGSPTGRSVAGGNSTVIGGASVGSVPAYRPSSSGVAPPPLPPVHASRLVSLSLSPASTTAPVAPCAGASSSDLATLWGADMSPSTASVPTDNEVRVPQECPICYSRCPDVEQLPHKISNGNIAAHRACRKCREELVKRNAPCPWCRTEMVWQTVFGVLDGLKGATRGYREGQHDELANLMTMWQEYEMCRTKSDISLFAREMATDPAVVARLEGAMLTSSGWLRDSAGLWIRFYGLYADGDTELSPVDGDRLRRAVDCAIESFEQDHGGHPDFVGAMYQQAAVAVLSASFSGLHTRTTAAMAKRVGQAALRVYRLHYGGHSRTLAQVRDRLNREYAEAVSHLVWGSQKGGDPILRTFFGGRS